MPEPVLKWAGGKRQILSEIRDSFPRQADIDSYHEPFFGGGALFFREAHPYAATISDVNERLMNFYWVVRDTPERFVEWNREHDHSSDEFGQEQQRRLCDVAAELHERGVSVVVSNSPPMRDIYEGLDGFTVHSVDARRSTNSDGGSRGPVTEIVLTNVDDPRRREARQSDVTRPE